MPRLSVLALLAMAVAIPGCGFHLRGTHLLGGLDAIEVRGATATPLGSELRETIGAAWSTTAPDRIVIVLRSSEQQRRPISVTEQARTSEYALTGSVEFSLLDADGDEHVRDTLVVERIYEVDAENLLGTAGEETLLFGEIRRELIAALLRRARILAAAGAD